MNRIATAQIIAEVRTFAADHIDHPEEAWDVVADMTDDQLADLIGRATTRRGGIWKAGQHAAFVGAERRGVLPIAA